jgi:putative restriction endonuclease
MDSDTAMRLAAFAHVRNLIELRDSLTASDLAPGFQFEGLRIPLINPQRGIFKPAQMSYLLSIKTVFPSQADEFGTTISGKCTNSGVRCSLDRH